MKNENMGLRRKLANVEKRVPDALSDELQHYLQEIGKLSLKNFDDHILLRNKYNLTDFSNVREKEDCKENLIKAFEVINRTNAIVQVFSRTT